MYIELLIENELKFLVYKGFNQEFLAPVGKYVMWKLINNWDDYNELYHATAYFEKVRLDKSLWIDSHLLMKNENLAGVAFVVGGKIKNIETRFEIENEDKSLLFKYFHIVEKGKGYGQKWLKEIIFPYYKKLEYEALFIGSSHPKSYSLYEKYGKSILEYNAISDNRLFQREGKFFKVAL